MIGLRQNGCIFKCDRFVFYSTLEFTTNVVAKQSVKVLNISPEWLYVIIFYCQGFQLLAIEH